MLYIVDTLLKFQLGVIYNFLFFPLLQTNHKPMPFSLNICKILFYTVTEMYQELRFVKEYGSLFYYPPSVAQPVTFYGMHLECRRRWANVYIPRNMTDWMWMVEVYERMAYGEMWIPIKENKDIEGTYQWTSNYSNRTFI